MKDAKGHGSEKRGEHSVDMVFSSKAGVGGLGKGMYARVNSGGMFKLNPSATEGRVPRVGSVLDPSQHIRVNVDHAAAQELARGNPKADTPPVHAGASGRSDSFFGRSESGARAAHAEAQDFQRTRATKGPHYLGANSRPQSAINRIKQPADVSGRPWKR